MNKRFQIFKLQILFFALIVGMFNSCSKSDSSTGSNNSTGGSGNPIQNNSTVKAAINAASVPVYTGSNPPTLEGIYSTLPMNCYAATGNLQNFIGTNMNTICKFYNQTSDGYIAFAEQISPNLFADGKGCYITGSGNSFTIWMGNSLSNGAETAFILSGTLDPNSGNLINCKSVTVYTVASASYAVGDWYAAQGYLEASGGAATGDGVFYVTKDFKGGPISVKVNGVYIGSITGYYSSGTPECGASICANVTKDPGTYSFTAECQTATWSGNITIVKGQCSKFHLTGK